MRYALLATLLCLAACGTQPQAELHPTPATGTPTPGGFQGFSLLEDSLVSAAPSAALLNQLAEKQRAYEATPTTDNLIWYARFVGYAGDYRQAIQLYSQGIAADSTDARLYRHRGHRYLSVREYGKAIADFRHGLLLREGLPNEVEPDGMPNAMGIPVSTLHGNLWYHLGLAYYCLGQYSQAVEAFRACLNIELSNDDNRVSATHWLVLSLCKLGQMDEVEAQLATITDDLEVIENESYWNTCRYYQGVLPMSRLYDPKGDNPSGLAERYGVAAWEHCQGHDEVARELYEGILAEDGWSAFGYLAAEADYRRYYGEKPAAIVR